MRARYSRRESGAERRGALMVIKVGVRVRVRVSLGGYPRRESGAGR